MSHLEVRPFRSSDATTVLELMKALAEFEGYSHEFAITEEALLEHGLGENPRFGVFVAHEHAKPIGIAVHYTIPWTFDFRPTVVLKELFVSERSRSAGAGRRLFQAVEAHCQKIGAPRLVWQVLPRNERAKKFYASLGGVPEDDWHYWKKAIPMVCASPDPAQDRG